MTTATDTTVLRTAIATYPHTKGLKDGTVTAPGIRFDHVEVSPITGAFRRMCRGLEFDLCEMAITTYLTARAYDKAFTALPVFVMRQFHHAPIAYNVKSGVASPRDLEGKKVGVRAYTVTTGVWVRGILATEYGVDLDKVTWVVVDEEHVQEYRKPVQRGGAPGGEPRGDAGQGRAGGGHRRGPGGFAGREAPHPERPRGGGGLVPEDGNLSHQSHGGGQGLAAARRPDPGPAAVRRLHGGEGGAPEAARLWRALAADAQALAQRRTVVGDDPLPYGLARNRTAIEAVIQFARDQKILPHKVEPEDVFASNTLEL